MIQDHMSRASGATTLAVPLSGLSSTVMRYSALVVCGLLFGLAQPSAAQSDGAPAGAAPAKNSCELHVWPTAGVNSMFYGWTHGSTVNAAAKGRKGYPAVPNDPLPPARQIELLQALPLEQLLERPAGQVIYHPQPLDRMAARRPGRHTDSIATCYGELIVGDIFYEEAVFSSRSLRTLFDYRAFNGEPGAAPTRFMTWAEQPLTLFPPKTDGDMSAALAEIGQVFGGEFRDFAQARLKATGRRILR